jgi:hypothetical protein
MSSRRRRTGQPTNCGAPSSTHTTHEMALLRNAVGGVDGPVGSRDALALHRRERQAHPFEARPDAGKLWRRRSVLTSRFIQIVSPGLRGQFGIAMALAEAQSSLACC